MLIQKLVSSFVPYLIMIDLVAMYQVYKDWPQRQHCYHARVNGVIQEAIGMKLTLMVQLHLALHDFFQNLVSLQ